MLLFALHHSKVEEPIAYFTSDLYSVFSKFMYRQFTAPSSLAKGLSITACCPPDDIFRKCLLGDYNGITDSRGNILGVVQCSWLAYIIPYMYKPSKFYLL